MKHLLLYLKELMKDYKNEVREILAGDKQLAKEIEFDLRRFDKEQWEEKNQREENDQRIPSREISNKGSNHDTLGSSPVLRERRLSVVEERDTSRPSTTCLPPPANIKELHTRAQVFSKDATARRKSVSVAGCVDGIREPTKLLQATVRLRRISIADFREHSCDVFPTREETTHVDPRAIGGYLPQEEEGEEEPNEKEEAMKEKMEGEEETVESAKDESREGPIKNKTRSELLRAISTPSTERTLINNLTFVNETQELSAININSTVASEKSNAGELQLHSTSPTSHKHESDFSRLRKTSKDMQQDPIESRKDKAKGKKKVTGQLFESFEAESSLSEAESTCESDVSAVTAVKRNEGKRTRHVASLSPDPEKNKSNTQTERPKLKKHKKKT
ncbi:uncharacterized protein LOC135107258 [Scylla paramamosain]|uniref:uncharacterized protein LOC135107258 n=1 Tax=Scylla paramamosain TaxID=85552 RepID=UPI0030834AF3